MKALVKFFTFIGLPKVVQSYQGSNLCLACFSVYYFSWEFNTLSQQYIIHKLRGHLSGFTKR